MQIEYVATRSKRTVSDAIGEVLIERKIARRVVEEVRTGFARVVEADESPKPKRKRRYKRRDMQAEGNE